MQADCGAVDRRAVRRVILLRPAEPSDVALIHDSWLRSYRGSDWSRYHGESYAPIQSALIDGALATCAVLVACLESDPTAIVGWCCTDERVVHYVWVRGEWRGQGIARLLLDPYIDAYTLYTHEPRQIAGKALPVKWHWSMCPVLGGTHHAAQTRQQQAGHRLEHQDGNGGRSSAEASGGDRPERIPHQAAAQEP